LQNVALIAAEIVIYFSAMATLFRLRNRFGIGVFLCALGTMHFLETYLAGMFYLQVPGGIVVSPGSTVLFTGKLLLLLLVYIREDAAAVRQPIYGLLLGNFLIVTLVFVMRYHEVVPAVPGRLPDFTFMDQMGWLMVWGTILLFIDAILIIILYEQAARWFPRWTTLRIWISASAVLTIDQVGFFGALYVFLDAPVEVLIGGWLAKMATGFCYSLLTGAYLRWFERQPRPFAAPRLGDVFDILTYRQRYEDLLERSGRDGLTGLYNRDRFEAEGKVLIRQALEAEVPLGLLVLDIDHFKEVNDRHGHAAGDFALREVADALDAAKRSSDRLFRYGGEEFVVVCPGLSVEHARRLAERLRTQVADLPLRDISLRLTVSIGVAACPEDGHTLDALFASADARLYSAKHAGRNRVWAGESIPWEPVKERSEAV
jgi:diguanylate cyclase (GGDEF)-like protein